MNLPRKRTLTLFVLSGLLFFWLAGPLLVMKAYAQGRGKGKSAQTSRSQRQGKRPSGTKRVGSGKKTPIPTPIPITTPTPAPSPVPTEIPAPTPSPNPTEVPTQTPVVGLREPPPPTPTPTPCPENLQPPISLGASFDGLTITGAPLWVNVLILIVFGLFCIGSFYTIKKQIEKKTPWVKRAWVIGGLLIFGGITALYAWASSGYELKEANRKLNENIVMAKSNSVNEVKVAPNRPESLYASATSDSQINLTWEDKSNSENGFYLERKLGDNGAYIQIASIPSNITSFSDTGLAPGTKAFYHVQAYNTEGKSEFSNESVAITPSTAKEDWANPWAVFKYVILPVTLVIAFFSLLWALYLFKVRSYRRHIEYLERKLEKFDAL